MSHLSAPHPVHPGGSRRIIILLAVCLALFMTGYGVTLPVFARRLGELGSGVGALSLMSTGYALAGILAAPIMGALADRWGRRPILLGSLVCYALANASYLAARSPEALIVTRALQGGLSAGLFPAALGIVADVAPDDRRSGWIGVVMGGASVGWILGPLAGGLFYDAWGYQAPFLLAAGLGLLALATAITIPKTHPAPTRSVPPAAQGAAITPARRESWWATLPRPLATLAVLLAINFAVHFSWAFFEPRMLFHLFDDLNWTTSEFGLASAAFGLASAGGQATLGRVGDSVGRKPAIVLGLLLFALQYAVLIFSGSLAPVMVCFAASGIGEGLLTPALGAFLMDIARERHRARAMGLRSSAGSIGGVLGPVLAGLAAGVLSPPAAFAGSVAVILFSALLALVVLRESHRARPAIGAAWPADNGPTLTIRPTWRGMIARVAGRRDRARQ